ncbi:MAG: hypothetical protein D6719_04365, partial [Candidatus Dadabacteria bacterium]
NISSYLGLTQKLGKAAERIKFTRFAPERECGVVRGYLEKVGESGVCRICGQRAADPESTADVKVFPDHKEGQHEPVCAACHDHIFLGKYGVKQPVLFVTTPDQLNGSHRAHLSIPIFGSYQVYFGKTLEQSHEVTREMEHPSTLRAWDISSPWRPDQSNGYLLASRLISGYVPRYDQDSTVTGENDEHHEAGDPVTLSDICREASGVSEEDGKRYGLEALGVLKADVDDLGFHMECGIAPEDYSIGRVATLSRFINNFFALYLPDLLNSDPRFNKIYTVFGGGDDLFLIGPWPAVIDLGEHLYQSFSEYVCANDKLHFSAGITLHHDKTPIEQLAREAEHALEQAKEHKGKNALSLFASVVSWDEVSKLRREGKRLLDYLESEVISHGYLYSLNNYLLMAEEEARLLSDHKEGIPLKNLRSLRWRALLAYSSARNVDAQALDDADISTLIADITRQIEDYRGAFRIPLWETLYKIRRS